MIAETSFDIAMQLIPVVWLCTVARALWLASRCR